MGERPTRRPLEGLRILDVDRTLDPIVASSLLADAGADVLLLDCASRPHPARSSGPFVDGVPLAWKVAARNKRWVHLSAARERDEAWLDALARRADVVIVEAGSFFGWTTAELSARHPHLVVLDASAFGATGPLAHRTGSGRTAEAFGGQVFAAGEPTRSPLHSGFPIGAATTAALAAVGVVAALIERDRGGAGRGQIVEVAGFECVLRLMEFLPINHQQTGFRNERTGGGSSYQVPVATWRTADDYWMTFTGNTNDVVHRLYRAMERPELIEDPRFATNEGRVANRGVVEATLADWARARTRAELVEACGRHAVPIGSVLIFGDMAADEHVAARRALTEIDDPELGRCRVPSAVPRFGRGGEAPFVRLGSMTALVDPTVESLWGERRLPSASSIATMGTKDESKAASGASRSPRGPFAGLRVVDFGQILAGPFAATLLADLGADVVKVEKPAGGDDFRRQAPLKDGISLWWKASARNKRSIALDLKDAADRARFLELVAQADVVTANFVPGALERMGLGFEDLLGANPKLVMATVSGYGQDGPYRERRAFGRNAEAFGGLAAVTGYADGPPLPTGFPVADGLSATLAAFGVSCAVHARSQGGEGVQIDVALYETILRMLELPFLVWSTTGVEPTASAFGTTAGELIAVAASKAGRWISASAWGRGPVRFSPEAPHGVGPDAERARRLEAIARFVEAGPAESGSVLADSGPNLHDGFVLCPVQSIDALVEDPHVRARETFVSVPDPELGEVLLVRVVPGFSRTPGRIRHAAPRLDEHRDAILREWLGQ